MSKGTILFADDDKIMRAIVDMDIRNFFPAHDFEFFEDGESLDRRLERDINGVCVVVTDNRMLRDGITGLEIIKKYALDSRFEGIPFILCANGIESEKLKERAIANGARAYVPKMEGLYALYDVLREALNQRE